MQLTTVKDTTKTEVFSRMCLSIELHLHEYQFFLDFQIFSKLKIKLKFLGQYIRLNLKLKCEYNVIVSPTKWKSFRFSVALP